MSTPSIEDVLRESLRHHLYDGCTNPACDPLSDPEACVGRPFLNHMIAEAADAIRAHLAEQADEAAGAVDLDLIAACPRCQARVGQPCRTRSGSITQTHSGRIRAALAGGASGAEGAGE